MIKKVLATAGIALVAFFAAPVAANAQYGPAPSDDSIVLTPGGTTTVPFAGFEPSEEVSFTLTGENGAGATLAVFRAAISSTSTTKTASTEGTTSVAVTLPTNATGDYTLVATGESSNASATAVITAAAAVDGDENGDGESDDLAVTGGTALTAIWIAGGALGLGVVLLLVRGLRRKATV
jgi:hypothetical protein